MMHKIRWEYKISTSFNLPHLDDVYSGLCCILSILSSEPIVSDWKWLVLVFLREKILRKKGIRKEIKLMMSKKNETANTFLKTCSYRKYIEAKAKMMSLTLYL